MNHIQNIRNSFPLFSGENKNIHYLDSAATAQKPKVVIDSIINYYQNFSTNVHRGAYELSDKVTNKYEAVRKETQAFMGAKYPEEIIFTSGTTESINLLASSLGDYCLKDGDEILVTVSEHHANFVPWQRLAEKKKAHLKVLPLDQNNQLDMTQAKELVSRRTKIFAFSHVSNVLGSINPIKNLMELAKEVGAYTVIDGAQYVPHFDLDVTKIDCDFYTFSAHKIMGPTGIGVLYGKKELLEKMPPYQTGGNMIGRVTEQKTTWNVLPNKFEAGTPNIAGIFGLGATYQFIKQLDRKKLLDHEMKLTLTLHNELKQRKNFTLYNQEIDNSVGIISFSHNSIHPHDIAFIADSHRVCIRSGHLCAQPLMTALDTVALSRVSLYLYNNENDIDQFLKAMHEAEKTFL